MDSIIHDKINIALRGMELLFGSLVDRLEALEAGNPAKPSSSDTAKPFQYSSPLSSQDLNEAVFKAFGPGPALHEPPPEVRLEVGKWYRSEKGLVVGPLLDAGFNEEAFEVDAPFYGLWKRSGEVFWPGKGSTSDEYGRLIAEVPAPRKEGEECDVCGGKPWEGLAKIYGGKCPTCGKKYEPPPLDPLPKAPLECYARYYAEVPDLDKWGSAFMEPAPGRIHMREITPRDAEVEAWARDVAKYMFNYRGGLLANPLIERARTLGLLPKEGE